MRSVLEQDALDQAASGGGLPRQAALQLIEARGTQLVALMHAASALRDRRTGTVVTYSRKVFIPLTHLCRDQSA